MKKKELAKILYDSGQESGFIENVLPDDEEDSLHYADIFLKMLSASGRKIVKNNDK